MFYERAISGTGRVWTRCRVWVACLAVGFWTAVSPAVTVTVMLPWGYVGYVDFVGGGSVVALSPCSNPVGSFTPNCGVGYSIYGDSVGCNGVPANGRQIGYTWVGDCGQNWLLMAQTNGLLAIPMGTNTPQLYAVGAGGVLTNNTPNWINPQIQWQHAGTNVGDAIPFGAIPPGGGMGWGFTNNVPYGDGWTWTWSDGRPVNNDFAPWVGPSGSGSTTPIGGPTTVVHPSQPVTGNPSQPVQSYGATNLNQAFNLWAATLGSELSHLDVHVDTSTNVSDAGTHARFDYLLTNFFGPAFHSDAAIAGASSFVSQSNAAVMAGQVGGILSTTAPLVGDLAGDLGSVADAVRTMPDASHVGEFDLDLGAVSGGMLSGVWGIGDKVLAGDSLSIQWGDRKAFVVTQYQFWIRSLLLFVGLVALVVRVMDLLYASMRSVLDTPSPTISAAAAGIASQVPGVTLIIKAAVVVAVLGVLLVLPSVVLAVWVIMETVVGYDTVHGALATSGSPYSFWFHTFPDAIRLTAYYVERWLPVLEWCFYALNYLIVWLVIGGMLVIGKFVVRMFNI